MEQREGKQSHPKQQARVNQEIWDWHTTEKRRLGMTWNQYFIYLKEQQQ